MAIQGGPDIVEDGLVLHLDAAEPLCFRGEPTTNVVANPNPTSGWGGSNSQGSTITRSFLTENGVPFMRFSGVTNGSDYPRVTDSVFTNSATITGSFSTSLEARGTSGAQIRLRIYDNSSTKITNTITLTNEWVRYKFENQSTSFALNQPYFNPVTTGATYDIRNIQIEAKPYSTSFVVGTRGSTVATGGGLLDITNNGNNGTINRAASPSAAFYSGDNKGSLVFDGVNDYADISNVLSLISALNYHSFSFWFNASDLSTDKIPFSSGLGGNYYIQLRSSVFYVQIGSFFRTYSFSTSINTWYNVSFVKSGTNDAGNLYINSSLKSSYTGSIGNTPSGLSGLILGRYFTNAYHFTGKISQVSIYNRALTPQEIQQNYNATKGRFGL